jgi:hypothetical protein
MNIKQTLALFTADKTDNRKALQHIHISDYGTATASNGHIIIVAATHLKPGKYTRGFRRAAPNVPNIPDYKKLYGGTKDTAPQTAKSVFTKDTLRVCRSNLEYNINYPYMSDPGGTLPYFEILINDGQQVQIAFDYAILMLQLDAVITGVYGVNNGLRWRIPGIDATCWTMAVRI